jgi:hypothetical protein
MFLPRMFLPRMFLPRKFLPGMFLPRMFFTFKKMPGQPLALVLVTASTKMRENHFFYRSLYCVLASAPQKCLSGDAADGLFSKSGGTFLSFRFDPA